MPAQRVVCRGLILLAVAVPLSVAAAERLAKTKDWPQWRGPERDAVSTETGLLKEWSDDGPPLEWKSGGLGEGYSSVAIAGGRIFTMGNRNREQSLIALSLDGGKELWTAKVGGRRGDGPRSTPTVDGDRVYALGTEGDLVCCQAADGAELWRKNCGADFGGRMMSGWGFCESPLVDGDKLVFTPGGKDAVIVALDKKTGRTLWKAALPDIGNRGGDGAGYSSIVISEAAGVKQYVQTIGRGTIGVAAADGKFLWGYNRIANGTANIPTPIVDGDYVFCSTGYGTGAALLKLVRDGAGVTAEEQYFLSGNDLQNHHGGMVLVDGYIYGGHGNNNGLPFCVEMKSGKILWKNRGPGSGSAAVVYADGRLYFRYENGVMALIEANPDSYQEKGNFKIPNVSHPSWAHPVVLGGRLYLREWDQLYCYRIDGKGA
jgi:outer membrane protein assembly factor BamB